MAVILRRRKLGLTSCREISRLMNEPCEIIRNDRPIPNNENVLFRWGTTSNIPNGYKVVNEARAIHAVNDKTGFRKTLDEHELCPPTCFNQHDAIEFVNVYGSVVIRPAHHAQGRNLYVCETENEVIDAINRCGEGFYCSQLINKVAEYRVFVAQGRAVWVAKKTPGNPDEVAWNVARGGRFDNVRWGDWPLKVVRTAIEGFNLSGLDFGGVDIMVDAAGDCFILEINSAPSQTSPYRQSCVAKVFDWIVSNGKEVIPLINEKGGWRKFIHPALSEEALTIEQRAA